MAAKQRRQLTEEERAERRERDREYARQAVERLRSSQGWKAWLTTRASFHSYSLGNQLLIAMAAANGHEGRRIQGLAQAGLLRQPWKARRQSRSGRRADPQQAAGGVASRTAANPDEKPRGGFKLTAVFDRLSRVRSGRCRRRPSREIRCLPSRAWLLVRASATAKGTAVACAVVAESAPEGDGAAAIARAPRRYPREQKRADQMPRMPPPCPHTGNLADRRQVAEGCRLALGAATSPARIAWLHHA